MTISSTCSTVAATLVVSLLAAVLIGCQGLHSKAGGGDPPPPSHGSLSASPASLSFGNVVAGQSASLTGSLRASGSTVMVSSVTGTNGDFAVSGISFPASIDAGQSLPFTVTFSPQVSGAASTTLGFVSNADNSPSPQSLTGTGTPAPQHSVGLSWHASNSDGVVGYNVYRKSDGDYSRINDALNAATSYEDGSVLAGATYSYVVTAVDGSGVESPPSKAVTALIPTP